MRAIILNEPGKAANLQVTNVPEPVIKDNEVLVQVKAISVNPVDVKARGNTGTLAWLMGDERPAILGWDISGIVTAAGSTVTAFKTGDAVFGMVNFPGKGYGYAEYVAADAHHLAHKPANISHEEAAAATLAALTAWQVLVAEGKIQKGQKVLIHAAAGGVGHYAVPIAKHLGAYVIGTSSAVNKDFVLASGADEHIDYNAVRFEELVKDADFVFDTVGEEIINRSIDAVKPGGTVITIPTGNIPEAFRDKAEAKGVNLSFTMVKSSGDDMKILAGLLEAGILKSHISQTFAFEDMKAAHEAVETGRTRGKVVVTLQ
jgi:NADPH:quinone reductase-like Zn-dependent oxidoreductase